MKILDPKTIARDIAKTYNLPIVPPPAAIHKFAKLKGYGFKRVGGKGGYVGSLKTEIARDFPLFKKCCAPEVKHPVMRPDYNPDSFIEPAGRKDYAWESKISRYIMEAIDELELFHGSPHDFNEFDFAYMSSGWGQQAYGYGAYLTTSYECAKEYSQGGIIYTVEIPDKGYLNLDRISPALAMRIARVFFNYYTKEHEYGSEVYAGYEREFWDEECKYIGHSTDGNTLYGTISSFLGSDKETSEFLHDKLGYKGLVWVHTNTETGKKFKNYVIFNPKDIKIIKKDSNA